jgi:hypothetical protein
MFTPFSFHLKLEIYKLIFTKNAQEIGQKGDDRKQNEEYCSIPGWYFFVIMFLDQKENNQENAQPHFHTI